MNKVIKTFVECITFSAIVLSMIIYAFYSYCGSPF